MDHFDRQKLLSEDFTIHPDTHQEELDQVVGFGVHTHTEPVAVSRLRDHHHHHQIV